MFEELVKYNMLNSSILLNTVEIKTKLAPKSPLNIPNSKNASGSADYVIKQDMLKDAISIYSPFLKAPGVIIKNGILYRTRGTTSITANEPMLLIVDGMQINQDFLSSIPVTDVAGIEILTSNYNLTVLGAAASGGAIYITTKNGNLGRGPDATNTAKITNFGYQVSKQFYSPDYDDPKTNQQLQDLRSTIYWNPAVITNDKGQTNLNFFNAGTPGTYRIVVEGMDAFGNIGRKVYTYQVKQNL
ncbi:MAG: hypothetical protein EOO93_25530 [Pedobacter sp.]|nr:MAG: hypothetical protein EOO93_25530 [Pedobacter sp.]